MASRLLPLTHMQTRRGRRDGFTLIELLVVVSIIGILAAIAIPAFFGRQGKAFDARIMQDARNAATAQEAFFGDTGSYYSGSCVGMPGVTVSPGVVCTAVGGPNTFNITTSHALATKTCVFSNVGVPNLICS